VKKAINRHKFTEKKRVELKQCSKKRGHGLTTDQMRMTEGGREGGRRGGKINKKIGMKERGIQAQTEQKE
jgi:hypothetical protein